jgi:hypothetical protein
VKLTSTEDAELEAGAAQTGSKNGRMALNRVEKGLGEIFN